MKTSNVHLNLNEAPFAPSGPVIHELEIGAHTVNRYPERDAITLRTALGDHWEVPATWVAVAGTGSIGLIQQTMVASGQGEIIYGWPTFEAFETAAQALHMPIRRVELQNNACDLKGYKAVLNGDTSIVIICAPNAPTGGMIHQKDLEEFISRVPRQVIVLIDEAYGEFVDDHLALDTLRLVKQYPNVVMTRTFSKAYGLAGIRVGYAIAQPDLAERIAKAGLPFPVSAPSQGAALVALGDQERLQKQIRRISKERRRLTDKLRGLGIEVVDGYGNFVWLPLGDRSQAVAQLLRNQGILVKPVMPYGVRITVGTDSDTDEVCRAWQQADITDILYGNTDDADTDLLLEDKII